MIQGIAWKRDCHDILNKAQVDLSFGSIGNPWGLSDGVYF